jgi:rhodanese-related sulfurtransferase
VNIPHRELRGRAGILPKDRLLVLADASGVYVREAAAVLASLGYRRIAGLNGGMLHWDQADLPVATDAGNLLHGQCPCSLKPARRGAR